MGSVAGVGGAVGWVGAWLASSGCSLHSRYVVVGIFSTNCITVSVLGSVAGLLLVIVLDGATNMMQVTDYG